MAIEVFGAGAVQSAYVSYLPLNITANSITLLWPTSYVNAPYIDPVSGIHYNILAASMRVMTNVGNTHTVTLPDATMSSVGSNFIITNIGAGNFSLLTSDTVVRQVIAAGISYWVQLTDNTTSIGVWTVVTFGAGVSSALANDLAGNGLTAIGTTLNADTPIVNVNALPINPPNGIDATFRAKLILWTGGTATLDLPAIGSVPAGYYVSFNNQASGSSQITIQPDPADIHVTIDRSSSIIVEVEQSLTIISDGTNWWTLGFGQNQFSVTSFLNLVVSGNLDVTLTNVQASNLIQNYRGALTGNITVFFPVTTNYWFINNNTTEAYTLSVQLAGPTGASYVVPQGTNQIFYSDGTSMFPIPTSINLSTPLSIASGGTGSTTQSTAANAILPAAANGDILYFNAGTWNVLHIGLPTQVLTVSAGNLPVWM